MATVRDAAAQIDWQLARADASAIAQKQFTFGQLPATRQDNLQRARDVMSRLAQDESYYREQTIKRLDNYERLKGEYVKYIKQRDEAALQGKQGSIGLMAVYTMDMVGNGMAAAGIPMAKFYTAVRTVGDKSVAAYESLRPYFPAPTPPKPAASVLPGDVPDMGFRMAHELPPVRTDAPAKAPDATSPASRPSPSPASGRTAEENIRTATSTLEAARELHKTWEERTALDRAHPGVNRYREWTRRQQDETKPEPFSTSKGGGQIADTTLKTVNSLTELNAARRSGETTRLYNAETQAVRDTLKSGSTMLDVLQKDRKLAGEHGVSGEFPVAAQFSKAFKTADKFAGGTQSVMQGIEAYYEARDGKMQKAWEHARDGATTAAKTFSRYGEQTEAAGKAVDDLVRYGQATDNRQRVTSLMEFVGHGTKVGTIPGAENAGEAILKAKDVVDQGYNFKEAYDLGHQDTFKPNLDRLGNEIMSDYELYIRLNEFKPLLNLSANPKQAVQPSAPK